MKKSQCAVSFVSTMQQSLLWQTNNASDHEDHQLLLGLPPAMKAIPIIHPKVTKKSKEKVITKLPDKKRT
jgi:hypothetical protein